MTSEKNKLSDAVYNEWKRKCMSDLNEKKTAAERGLKDTEKRGKANKVNLPQQEQLQN